MPIEAVKIPQNVQIEDRIIGPLSLRQIIIMAIGGGISYAIFGSMQKALGSVPIPLMIVACVPAAIAALFALVKINDLSITRIIFLLLEKTQKPMVRTWVPRTGISINFRTSAIIPEEKPKKTVAVPEAPEHQLRQLSSAVDHLWQTEEEEPFVATQSQAKPEPEIPEFDLPLTGNGTQKSDAPLSDLNVFRDLFPPSNPPSPV